MSSAGGGDDDLSRKGPGGVVRAPTRLAPWRWNWAHIVRRDPTRLLDDVFARPSVPPLAAWMVSGLVALISWLAWRYAAGAAERATKPHGLDEAGLIPEDAGRLTILIVAALALIAGWEPVVMRRFGHIPKRLAQPILAARRWFIAWPRALIGALLWIVWRAPSVVLSLLDWVVARPIALLAGVRAIDFVGPALSAWFRYAILAFWVVGAALAATRLSGTHALWALVPGFLAIFGIVRRWTWVERDRAAFLIERGGPAHKRVGFQEDLRDEALTAMVGLFALIPIALGEIDVATNAFDFVRPNGEPIPGEPSLWQWIGYFGAELAKTAPFVDWSEVYHVANGSPIRPRDESGLGASVVFLLRAGLDLLLLAAVLQAVQIAARLRDQNAAFRSGQLPILDPFAELAAFRALARRKLDKPILRKLADAVADFPSPYDAHRLAEIAAGADPKLRALVARKGEDASRRAGAPVERDKGARDAAMLVLAGQHPTSSATERLLSALAVRTFGDEARRSRALALLAESNPAAAEQPLLSTAADNDAAPSLRMQALRDLGWLRRRGGSLVLSALLNDVNADPLLRIHAGLALVKARRQDDQTIEALQRLSVMSQKRGDARATMSAAYALSLASRQAGAAASAVAESESQSLVKRVVRSITGEWDKMAAIRPGAFPMGAAPGERGANANEYPQREVSIAAFEMGAYAVTFEEYDDYCDATGQERPPKVRWGRERRPVIHVSWEDADAYCDWLNGWTAERFRLPSEAEWEYACRAGSMTPFNFGETISTEQANYDGNDAYGHGKKGECRQRTTQVGSFPANAFGLFDMHGNLWEWCADAWSDNYNDAPGDGSARLYGDTSYRVLRGGCWNSHPNRLRSAARFKENPARRGSDTGFRLARSVSPR